MAVFSLSLLCTKAQVIDSTLAGKIPDSTKVTFNKVYADVKEGLSGLAAGLKTGVSHVYEVLVRQQLVISITDLIFLIASFISIIFWIKAYKSKEEWQSLGVGDATGVGVVRIIQIVISLIILVVAVIYIPDMITGFVNPEYGAIKEIISFVK